MRRFYAAPENFSEKTVALDFEETKHLRDVLRLREKTEVYVFDGSGNEIRGLIEAIKKRETQITILEKVSPKAAESNLNLTLVVAVLKGEKFDLVVQKACELGVSKVIPLQTKRADVKFKNASEAEKKLERWRKIALEAAKQSGRARLMHVDAPLRFEGLLEKAYASQDSYGYVLFSEKSGESLEDLQNKIFSEITAVVGAEGGWEDAEIEAARAANFQIITLGGRILRAETAAIVSAALLQNHFGDLK